MEPTEHNAEPGAPGDAAKSERRADSAPTRKARRAARASKAPQILRDRGPQPHDPDHLATWTFAPIGVVRSPFLYVHDAPRQGTTGPGANATDRQDAGAVTSTVRAEIVLRKGMQNCLRDLAGFERVWVLFVFNHADGWNEMLVPPRDTMHRGVLATRAPHRPNPIGLTCARIISVRARTVTIDGHDLLDGTPVLDLKPYLPYADAHPNARAGWTETLAPDGPDHRWE